MENKRLEKGGWKNLHPRRSEAARHSHNLHLWREAKFTGERASLGLLFSVGTLGRDTAQRDPALSFECVRKFPSTATNKVSGFLKAQDNNSQKNK